MRRSDTTLDEDGLRELATLEAELGPLVVTVREEPSPTWAAELDRRAEAGFARPRRAPVRPWLRTRTLLPVAGLAAAALVVVVAVAGSGGGSSSGGSSSAGGGANTAVPSSSDSARSGGAAQAAP
ncbi:MAG TPA: hypothetical protein VGI54_08795, partial [Solirubrobacteraceae bacterium]